MILAKKIIYMKAKYTRFLINRNSANWFRHFKEVSNRKAVSLSGPPCTCHTVPMCQ